MAAGSSAPDEGPRQTPSLFKAQRAVWSFLVPRHRRWLLALGTAMPLLAAFETAVLGFLALYVSAVANPDAFAVSRIAAHIRGAGIPLPEDQRTLILFLSGLVVACVLIKNACVSLFSYGITKIAESISAYFGARFLQGAIAMPYEWHLTRNSADLATSLAWRDLIGAGLVRNSLQILSDLVLIAFLSVTLIAVRPVVSLAVLAAAGGGGLLIFRWIGPQLDRKASIYRSQATSINREALQILAGIKEIKLFGAGARLKSAVARMRDLSTIQAARSLLVRMPRDLLEFLGIAVLAGAVAGMTMRGDASPASIAGTVTLLAVTAWRVLPAVTRVAHTLSEARVTLPMTSQILGLLERFREEERRAAAGAEPALPVRFTRSLRAEGLGFTYAGRAAAALAGIDFDLAKGESLGLVGPSGAGKSTLADLLSGLLAPTEGRLLIDGIPLTAAGRSEWMRMIGYVSQAPFLADDTLAANIAFGEPEDKIDRELVAACCAQAQLAEVVAALPRGFDSTIGERGIGLSGGQRQRVAIARALYRRPLVIILDEATSALDAASEALIRDTIAGLRGAVTMIIISHRLGMVRACDKLLWLEHGRIAMFGEAALVMSRYTGPE
ncbi:MAG TPA: ABC transporter ATP-binding protein [Planctomycetota bacterium]|jgi:ABC-type multidrug transport system fused ATPase/permease subunit|nr:ABC transporter ATP-binding protein [Planctomycetota bacterium]OQC19372.1 MAG: Lipid A export ATP-binding/permease protein MsbA [Planctomycetes bacterium ADurb.Bin069]HNR99966.1 ABC transporter ATP-binding protein [Planctomycetota bacterium]HNU25674.1 ABC transporter ATP-binding protein [Planctomycetota bacterium]HOE31094.1 ABC transporter ATP-binding protein [Planctomycetota bacterium]